MAKIGAQGLAGEYSITLHAARRFVAIVFTGFWSVETVEGYVREREATVRALAARGCPLATCTMLTEARGLKAQPLDSVAEFSRRVGGSAHQPLRSALLVASALFRMQGERMAIPNQRIFGDRAEAMRWLAGAQVAVR